jgi:hypothetical protein
LTNFFEAFDNFNFSNKKKHTITIEGKTIEVPLQKKLEVMNNGEENYYWKSNVEFSLRKKEKTKIVDPVFETRIEDVFWDTKKTKWRLD